MSTITTNDGTQIYYKDWGSEQPVVFSHGWPLSADAWEDQMVFLAAHGYRCKPRHEFIDAGAELTRLYPICISSTSNHAA